MVAADHELCFGQRLLLLGWIKYHLKARLQVTKSLFAVVVGDTVSLGLYIKKERGMVMVCSNLCVVSYFIKNKESLASHGRLKDVLGLGDFDELCAWRLS